MASPVLAQAQSVTIVDNEYDGNLVRIDLYLGVIRPDSVDIYLPPGFEIVSLWDDVPNTYFTSQNVDALCSAVGDPPIRTCTISPSLMAPTADLSQGWHPNGGTVPCQKISLTAAGSMPSDYVHITARLKRYCSGSSSQDTVAFVIPPSALTYGGDSCTSVSTPDAVTVTPLPAIAGRASSPTPLTLTLEAVFGASTVGLNAAVLSPTVLASMLKCRRTQLDTAFRPCTDAEIAAFVTIAAVSESPARITVTPLNSGTPDAGDLELQVTSLGSTQATGTATVTIEQNVTTFTLAAQPSGTVTAPSTTTLVVQQRQNSAGGNEPPRESWAVTSVSPASLDTTARGWFDAATHTLTVPSLPSEPVTIQVTATHTNPDSSTVASSPLTISVAQAPPSCSLVIIDPGSGAPRTSSVIGPGSQATLQIVRSDGASPTSQDLQPVWSIESGDGRVEPASGVGRATYFAPPDATVARVHADVQGGFCAETSITADVQVVQDVQVRLAFSKPRVTTGGVAKAVLTLANTTGAPVNGVVLRARVPQALAPAARLPAGTTGGQIQPLEAPQGELAYKVDLDAAPEHQLTLPFLARAAFTCGSVKMQASLHRDAAGAAISASAARIELACEPELGEATLVGRVFKDANGNGVQDEGEIGIPGALVASAAGVYAVTDTTGSYHIARLTPGRHTIKVDRTSLPVGARVPDERREITLTPGGFARVSFAVQLPSLSLERPLGLDATQSGLRLVAGRPVYHALWRLPAEGTLVAERGKTRITATLGGNEAALDLPLDERGEHWLLTLRTDDGRVWLWIFAVHLYAQAGGGRLVIPWGPRPLGGVILPSATRMPSRLSFAGELREPVPLAIDAGAPGASCVIGDTAHGPHCEIAAKQPVQQLELEIDAPADTGGDDPPPLTAEVTMPQPATRQFVVGRARLELGGMAVSGEKPRLDGDGAFFYRGVVGNDVLVTAGADLPGREILVGDDGRLRSWGSISSRLMGHDPRRVFRELDPELFYPTYGDSSVTVDEREAGGRLFLRLQSGQSFAKWGGVNTAINDAEYGQYVRSLYGFGAQLSFGKPEAPLGARAIVFGAQPDSVAARDELEVTGSSLYFLAHRDVVEGSLRVSLEVLDEVSGLPIRVVPLIENVDYTADYLGGHLSLDPALPARTFSGSLTAAQSGGGRARLVVDYEYMPGSDLTKDVTAGGRLVLRAGPFSLGGTAVGEMASLHDLTGGGSPHYGLLGATARLDLGPELRLRLELARSEGTSHVSSRSSDGGLTFEAVVDAATRPSGNAVALEVASTLGVVETSAYGRYVEPGFTDSRTALGQKLRQAGARLGIEPWHRARLWAQGDYRKQEAPGVSTQTREVGLAGISQSISIFDLAAEGRYEALTEVHASVVAAGAEAGVRPVPGWRLWARRRQVLRSQGNAAMPLDSAASAATTTPVVLASDGQAPSASAVGVSYAARGGMGGAGEVGVTDSRQVFSRLQATMPLVDGTELYAAYVTSAELSGGTNPAGTRGDSLLVGGRQKLGDGSLLYSQQQISVDGSERLLTRSVGAETSLSRKLSLVIAYERGTSGDAGAPETVRDAGNIGTVYQSERWSLRLGVDGRNDDGPLGHELQLGSQGRFELRATDALTLAAGGRGASTYLPRGHELAPTRQSWEGEAGFAIRPPRTERVNAFGRYALQQERLEATAEDPRSIELSHIVALAVLVNVIGPLDVGPKAYFRHTSLRRGDDETTDDALLVALRGDWHLGGGFDASVEGRTCRTLGAHLAPRYGALVEASAMALDWLRLGAGYNLSSISTDGVRCDEPGARGVFVRAEVVY